MPIAYAGVAAAVIGAGSTLANDFSGSPTSGANGTYGGSNPGTYIPSAQPQADQYYQSLLGNLNANNGTLGAINPGLAYDFNQFYFNNPYAIDAQNGANAAGAYGTNTLAPQQQQGAAGLQNLGNQVAPYGSTILNTAFDPQTALYNQTAQNVLGQSAVANAQSGVQGPAAAGVTDNNINNFNIQWQNQQLARQLQGLQGYGTAEQTAGQAYSGASTLGGAAQNTINTSASLPYQNNLNYLNNVYSQYGNLGTALNGQYGTDIAALQSYLNLGQSATGIAQNGQQTGFNENQTLGSNLGSSLNSLSNNQALANLFGGGSNPNTSQYGSISQPSYYGPSSFDSSANADYGNAGY